MSEAIEILCERFGTTVSELISVMSQYYRTAAAVDLAICVFIFLLSGGVLLWLILREREKHKKDSWYDWFEDEWTIPVVIIDGIVFCVALIMMFFCVRDFAMATEHPDAYAIQKILDAMK